MHAGSVIAIGEALIDRLGPPGGDPSFDLPVIDCFGGAPANVACALSRLGASVSFMGALGNDLIGKDFKNLMIDRGINIHGLQEDKLRPTRIVLVRRDVNGESVRDEVIFYLNRLSDWLFVLGRWISMNTGEKEKLWTPLGKRKSKSEGF